ncbi:lipoprotein [Bacillus luti]
MKRVMYVVLLLSFVIGMTACNDETSSSHTLLSIGKPAQDNVIYYRHTDNKRKIQEIQDMFQNKKWKRNETFSTVNKIPDVVFSIDEDNTGLPTLYVTVYFHEDGADAINLYGEHTTLNKEELDKLREKMSAYYPKMILGIVS